MGSSVNYDVENGETAKPMLGTTSSESDVLSCVRFRMIRDFVANVRKVIFGTKLLVLFPAIPMAFVAHYYSLDRPWIFGLSLLGLTPLAERLSFLTE
ncbi:putative calcium/proton exchanger [Helianthus annuus]|nr:putative calcium/proton exchanger [Helianthus annuus]